MALPYKLILPNEHSSCAVFASPHSGRNYPADFLRKSSLDAVAIRSSEDAYVDLLFAAAPDCGAPLLCATAPRAYVDVNRSADELDPAVVAGVRQRGHNPRISSGLGVIPRVVANGREILQGKVGMAEAKRRIDGFYTPYHQCLGDLLDHAVATFGIGLLFDCHSMPHEALVNALLPNGQAPDIVLGDRFGASCDSDIVADIEAIFRDAGLQVARNAPFAGAFVTQQYGRPARGQNAIQIEINRALYLDETRVERGSGFDDFKACLDGVISRLAELGVDRRDVAAE